MAYEFPRYLSKAKATTQQPSAFAAESTEGQITEQVAKVAGVAQEATYKWGLAYQEAQKTQAELNQRTQIDDLLARAEADPDYNALEKYQQENEKIKTQSLSGFKNNFTKGEAAAKANYYSSAANNQLTNIFRKKMIDNQQANTMRLLDLEAKNPSEDTFANMKAILEKQKSLGFLSETDALKLEEKYTKQAKQNAFLTDLSTSPDLAQENLGNYGFDVSETGKARKMIEAAKKKEKEAFKNAHMATVNGFGEKLANRSLTVEELEDAVSSGLIDSETGAAFELALAGPDQWSDFSEETEQRGRSKLITNLLEKLSPDDVDSRMKIVKSSLQNYNDKKLNVNDLSFILRVANGQSKDPNNKIWGYLTSALSMVANQSPGVQAAKGLMKFKERWDMQEDPRDVMKQAMVDQFKEDKPETAAYKIGDVIQRKSGSYEVSGFNEDGSPVFKKK